MAGLKTSLIAILVVAICLQDAWADHHFAFDEQDSKNNVMSYEAVGTGAYSTSDNANKQNTGLYAFRRQRRSLHNLGGGGGHYYQPVYTEPVVVAPANGYYQGYYHPQPQTNSHSQAQAISANFGGNHYLGTGGSGISAAAASASSGTGDQLHYGYGRK